MYAALEVNILALIICAGIYIRIKKYNLEVIGSERFIEMLAVLVTVLASEVLILLFETKILPPNYYVHMCALAFYFLGQTIMPVVLFLYNIKTQNLSISNLKKYLISMPILFEVFILIANLINPFAYVVGANSEYTRMDNYLYVIIISFIYIFIDLISAIIGFINRKKSKIERYCLVFSFSIIIEAVISFAIYGVELYPMITISLLFLFFDIVDKRSDEIDEEACTDSMTGLGNARAYQKKIDSLDRNIEKNKNSNYSVVVMDINNLKVTNDKFGHQTGNKLILSASKCIQECFKNCSIFRIGGDEFVAILEEDVFDARYDILNAFKEKTDSCEITAGDEKINLTIAVGMADFVSENDLSYFETFRMADRNMYDNKYEMKHRK